MVSKKEEDYSYRPNYSQPHNIRIAFETNACNLSREIEREHGRQKYFEKYQRSKQSKRVK